MDYSMRGGVLRMKLRAAPPVTSLRKWSVDCSPTTACAARVPALVEGPPWPSTACAMPCWRQATSLINNGSKPRWTEGISMLAKLERLIGEIGDLNSKLILLVGPSRSGKTQLLRQLGAKLNIEPLNVGLELGRRLAPRRTTSAASRQANCCGRSRTIRERTETRCCSTTSSCCSSRACRSTRLTSSGGWLTQARRGRLARRAAR